MNRFSQLGAMAFAVVALIGFASVPARAAGERSTLAHAEATVDDLRHDGIFRDARRSLRHARAVLIVPSLVKGGFIFGAEGGDGVLLARTGKSWSSPAFYSLGSASFGLQIGLEQAQVVMIIMTDKALRAIKRSKFKFGVGGGLTIVTLGAGAEGATSGNLSGDIIVWSKAKGAYGGITLNGSVLDPDQKANAHFYGHRVDVDDILGGRVKDPATEPLRRKLDAAF